MSHVIKIDLVIEDIDVLKQAVESIPGLEWRDKKTYRWFGAHVGDYPLPEGFSPNDLGRCEFSIGVKDNPIAYEVGVVRRKDGKGYHLLVDFWNRGYGLCDLVGEKIPDHPDKLMREGMNCYRIANAYAAHMAAKTMRKQGYSVRITTSPTGQYQVACRR